MKESRKFKYGNLHGDQRSAWNNVHLMMGGSSLSMLIYSRK